MPKGRRGNKEAKKPKKAPAQAVPLAPGATASMEIPAPAPRLKK